MPDSQNGDVSDMNPQSYLDWDAGLPTWWQEHYREILMSGQYSCQDIMVDLTHEFMVPLEIIRGYAELIRDHLPPSPSITLTTGETVTSRDFAEVILKAAARQMLMLKFARFGAWENPPPNEEQNSQ